MKLILLFLTFAYLEQVSSHGMMLEPPNRGSLWRFYPNQPINYEDNEFFCGGFRVQYTQNGGKCGPCGDNYADAPPRLNENTGFYGKGLVTRNYIPGSVIDTQVNLTANHLGSFTYSLCVLGGDNVSETEECFVDLPLADTGSTIYQVAEKEHVTYNKLQLPEGLTCERCVLRWHYRTGNSWGDCPDGTNQMGCGDQEIFRSCADISIGL